MRGTHTNLVIQLKKDSIPIIVPVKVANLHSADSSPFKQACPDCQSQVGRKNVCKGCEKELETKEMLKGFPISKTELKIFSPEQIEALKNFDDVVTILSKTSVNAIDPKYIQGGFIILPDEKIPKKRGLEKFKKVWKSLERSLAKSEQALIVKFSIRQKEKIGYLFSQNNRLVLLDVVYAENQKEIDENPEVEVTDLEVKSCEGMLNKFPEGDIAEIENTFNKNVENLLENGETVEIPEAEVKEEQSLEELFAKV